MKKRRGCCSAAAESQRNEVTDLFTFLETTTSQVWSAFSCPTTTMESASASISVAVRIRPLTGREAGLLGEDPMLCQQLWADNSLSATPVMSLRQGKLRKIIKACDDRVLVFDPESPLNQAQKHLLGSVYTSKKTKDIRFCFDRVFDEDASQQQVYEGSAQKLLDSVLGGFNAVRRNVWLVDSKADSHLQTVFAYGATGCGKTHTISGSASHPGIVYLLMKDLFDRLEAQASDKTAEISSRLGVGAGAKADRSPVSYLEIYNETIKDLIVPGPPLMLREAGGNRVVVPGLSEHRPTTAEEVITLIHEASANRTTNHTEANATSSRSHAVLSVNVKLRARTANISEEYQLATLSVIDLAGSERASVTMNKGARLHEGANINRSLLALGNCINALCDPRARGHVPYRDSKLTRLLKHSLGGNCQTSMIVCVSPSSQHYDETHNTLQYANRAKEIKTKVSRNVVSVDRHVSQYVKIIYELRTEVEQLKKADRDRDLRIRADERAARAKALEQVAQELSSVDDTRRDTTEKATNAAWAKAELEALARLRPLLQTWLTATGLDEAPSSSASQNHHQAYQQVKQLTAGLQAHGQTLQQDARAADNAKAMLDANMQASRRKLTHSEALEIFDRESALANRDMRLEESRGRERGALEATKYLCSVLATLSTVQLLLAGEAESFQAEVQAATSQVFASLAAATLPGANASPVKQRIKSVHIASTPQARRTSPKKPVRSAGRLKSSFMSPRKKAVAKLASVKKTVLFREGAP
jgi:kinesin family protein 18/19